MLYRLKTAFPGVVEIFNYTGVLYTNALSICKLRNIADLRYKPGAFLQHSDSFQSAEELARRLDVRLTNSLKKDKAC